MTLLQSSTISLGDLLIECHQIPLKISLELFIDSQNISRRVVGLVVITISPSYIFGVILWEQR